MALTKVTSGLISADASSVDLNIDAGTLYIDSTNNRVGVANTSPSAKFDVQSATGNVGFNYGTSSSPERGNLWYDTDGTGWKFNIGKVQSGSFTSQVTIQDNGNVGIGTSSPSYKLALRDDSTSAYPLSLENSNIGTVGVHTGIRFGYIGNTYQKGAIIFESQDANGRGKMYFAMEGTANSSNVDETDAKMTIDYTGNVGIGTSSPNFSLDILGTYGTTTAGLCVHNNSTAAVGNVSLISFNMNNTFNGTDVQDITIGAVKTNAGNRESDFVINSCSGTGSPQERLRVSSSGSVYQTKGYSYVGYDGTTYSSGEKGYYAYADSSSNVTYVLARNVADGSAIFLGVVGGTTRAEIEASGDFLSATNSYSSTSDEKLKQDITDANSQWDDIKNLRVRNFKYKTDVAENGDDATTMLGVVAQEVELVSPNLVKDKPDLDHEGNDLGTTTKTVKYSILYMKAIKALQEAMTKIEDLEARITALENT